MNELRMKRIYLREENKKFGPILQALPRADWPTDRDPYLQYAVGIWRSRDFLVVEYVERDRHRLSINRTELASDGRFKDGITWDEIQRLKREAGHGSAQAIEFYPPDQDIVNVANIRHIFLMDEPLTFQWTKV